MQANHAREGSEIPVTDATLPGPPWWSQSPLDASSFPVHTALLFALSALPDGHGLLAQPSRCSDCRNPLSQPAVQAVVGVDIDIDIDSGDQTRQPYLISSAAHQRPSIVVLDDTTPARYRCRLSFFSACSTSHGLNSLRTRCTLSIAGVRRRLLPALPRPPGGTIPAQSSSPSPPPRPAKSESAAL
ncbi:hypothetical protein HBH98_028510 [Parastagonospora nodorum]|nr:hypothetical protein HBH53_171430 [Parastagonospora nodorum]KAH3986745.1 hypothetical protein HBH51_014060 [Parastagonospora nodorum]KAH4042420.1 hypothetical protein HBI09_012730 [Parastagonospora nodorum]KAH4099878.1 hypothetical protein HBH48_012960 [Parastagonospora nodorum]KAH4128042.1 hypothetical protein HBH47_043170 [Parastagonospora nodorum]